MTEDATTSTATADVSQNTTDAGKAGEADKTQTSTDNKGFDFSQIGDDELPKLLEDPRLWKLPRIQELREKAKVAKEYEAEKAKREQDELTKKGKFDEVLSQKDSRIKELEDQLNGTSLDNLLRAELQKAGVKNIEAGLRMFDKSGLKVNESGQIEGFDQALESFKKLAPELLTSTNASVGTGTNPANPKTGEPIKMSNVRDPRWFNDPANAQTIRDIQTGKIAIVQD
jgi:Phage minor structural protein GP20